MKHIKRFNESHQAFCHGIVTWPSEVNPEDITDWEKRMDDVIDETNTDTRMSMLDIILQEVKEKHPELYDDLEEDIKDITLL